MPATRRVALLILTFAFIATLARAQRNDQDGPRGAFLSNGQHIHDEDGLAPPHHLQAAFKLSSHDQSSF